MAARSSLLLQTDPKGGPFIAIVKMRPPKPTALSRLFGGSDTNASDRFGESLALDGDRLLVGARYADGGIANAGQAYVFERTPGTEVWVETAILAPPVPDLNDGYGRSVALEGDRLVVGAHNDSLIYCYQQAPGSGQWVETQILQISGAGSGPSLGISMSMSGGRLLVGAPGAYVNMVRGLALIYEVDPVTGLWIEQERFQPGTTPSLSGNFGISVALQGDRALIGNALEYSGGVPSAGTAYLYEWDSVQGTWGLAQFIEPSAPSFGAQMGQSVTIDGDLICLGAPIHSLGATNRRGVLHRFRRDALTGMWNEEPIFPLPMDVASDNFPRSLALSGENILAGVRGDAIVLRTDSSDCNGNGIGDLCEISAGTADDYNQNFVPDECEALGFAYCSPAVANSTGMASQTFAIGSGLTTDLEFTLQTLGVPNSQFAYYLASMGTTVILQPAGSQGNLCIAGSAIGRFNQVGNILVGVGNHVTLDVDLSAIPQTTGPVAAMAGETWYFQLWHRDFGAGGSSNFSDARGITFQ